MLTSLNIPFKKVKEKIPPQKIIGINKMKAKATHPEQFGIALSFRFEPIGKTGKGGFMTQAYTYTKRIGNSRYLVKVSFDEKANDTFEDKLLKMIEQDVATIAEEHRQRDHDRDDPTQPAV